MIDYNNIPTEGLLTGKYIPSTFCDDLDEKTSELTEYLRKEIINKTISASKIIKLLESKKFKRLGKAEEVAINEKGVLLSTENPAYNGAFINKEAGLIAEVLDFTNRTNPFIKIYFRNSKRNPEEPIGSFIHSCSLCSTSKDSQN